jgi:Tol biopolymer transport system component
MANKQFSNIYRLLMVIALLVSIPAWPQVGYYFGQNKVKYKDFDWAVFRTEHFDVHYYPEAKQAAEDAARMAERGYDYLGEILNHQIKGRIPLILYASVNDFQQTNVVDGLIGEGTRGVTEGLKNRVVLPITGSYREFNHVLVHELVHAFQFDMMFGGKYQNTRFNPPLWFVEGMAEYLSNGMDNTTRMWVRDGLLNDNLISVEKLNGVFDIRVYRLGQSVWHFIGERYGKQKVGEIFKAAIGAGNIEMAIKSKLNITLKELTAAWHEYSRKLVIPEDPALAQPDEIAQQLSRQESYYHRMNIAPAVSPDGKNIAYIANKDLNDEIFLLSEKENGEFESKRLIKGGSGKQFEAIRFFETGISWSADGGMVAFVSKSGKNDAIYVMDPFKKKTLKKLVFKELNGLLSPTFSPRADQVAFVGIRGGISDLYVYDVKTETLTRLSNDRFAVLHPSWSPTGEAIAFVSDRGKDSNLDNLLFSDYDLAIYHLDSGEIEMVTQLDGNVTSPQWSPDGKEIAFVASQEGIPNIYKINLQNRQVTRLTALKNGVSGITETTPALSWSADGKTMVFSAFYKNSWHLYRMEVNPETPAAPAVIARQAKPLLQANSPEQVVTELSLAQNDGKTEPANTPESGVWLPELPDPNNIYEDYQLADTVESRKYSKKFRLDGVAVGAGYSNFFGVEGGASFVFSDMLGNHNLFLSTGLRFNSFLHSDVSATYFNQGGRINYGLQAFQLSNQYAVFGNFFTLGSIRDTYRGFNALIAYPFDRFTRIELSGGLTWVERDLLLETFTPTGVEREDTGIETFNFAQVGAAWVYDNTLYGILGPMSGTRSRFSVETALNDFNFTILSLDYRKYFKMSSRTVLAWRLLGAASLGEDRQIFSIGGPYSFRGSDYDALIGTRFFISNLEYRFPLLPFLPPGFDMLSMATFADVAAAWGINAPGFSSEEFRPFSSGGGFRLQDLKAALGLGLRVNIGYFLLQYDYAWPTDGQQFGKPVGRFSIGTFF